MIYLGIDPGATGALAVVRVHADQWMTVHDCPIVLGGKSGKQKQLDVAAMAALVDDQITFRDFSTRAILPRDDIRAAVETQQAYPQQGSSSTFKLAANYGAWQGILAALGIPFELVRSQDWKPRMGISRGASKGESRARASTLFPSMRLHLDRAKDDGRAEALLIAEDLRRRAA